MAKTKVLDQIAPGPNSPSLPCELKLVSAYRMQVRQNFQYRLLGLDDEGKLGILVFTIELPIIIYPHFITYIQI